MAQAFLQAWATWQNDPQRPQQLHFMACLSGPELAQELPHSAAPSTLPAPWQPLQQQLNAQSHGLLPGVQRLNFAGMQVLLTLLVGDCQTLLRQQQPVADDLWLGPPPLHTEPAPPSPWSAQTLKTIARCCRRGSRLLAWPAQSSDTGGQLNALAPALQALGFQIEPAVDAAWAGADQQVLQARFDPAWQPRAGQPPLPAVARPTPASSPHRAAPHGLVIGAGLAGSAVAASLARRGWRVTVLDAAAAPAAGASGLPAGLFASHVSPDDSLLSRLSRAGVRLTLQTLTDLLPHRRGLDWDDCGVLEHGVDGPVRLAWQTGPGLDWSRLAHAQELQRNQLAPGTAACWHGRGGWVRPPALVQALLAQPGITWRGLAEVARLQPVDGQWQALDATGTLLAQAELAVVCAGPASGAVAGLELPLQALRGQILWGLRAQAPAHAAWPAQPVNGHGNLVPQVPLEPSLPPTPGQEPTLEIGWVLGSTFERDCTTLPPSPADQAAGQADNQARLARLLPALGRSLDGLLDSAGQLAPWAHSWAAVRCAAPDRLPLVGPADAQGRPGLWLSTAMGARGLTLALLCAELLATRLHAEPLPLEARLARALMSERF